MNLSERVVKYGRSEKLYMSVGDDGDVKYDKIPLSDLSFLSFLSSQGGCFAVVADLCGYFAEVKEVPA